MTQGSNNYSVLSDESLDKAFGYFSEKGGKNPQDVAMRLMLADTQRLMGDMEAAEQTIVEGMKISDNPVFKSALSEIYCQVFIKTAQIRNGDWTGNIELLEKSAPSRSQQHARVSRKLPNLLAHQNSTNETLMAQLRENLAAGRATSITHSGSLSIT